MEQLTENDPRSTQDLIQASLNASDDETRWAPIRILHRRASKEVLDAALALCDDPGARERSLGADILAQLGLPERTHPESCAATIERMFQTETDLIVLASLAGAAGHLEDPRLLPGLLRLGDNPDLEIRRDVTCSLSRFDDDRAIEALIKLSEDEDSEIRDWATFGLGSMTERDTPAIREALLRRLEDSDDDARGKALVGLASRKDTRVVEPLKRELSGEAVGSLAIEAAEEISDPRLLPLLQELRSWWDVNPELLERAIVACTG
jgi:HEAT repeat protein